MKWTCILDLDGVLVDFVGGAFALHGKSVPRNEVSWDFPGQIGFGPGQEGAFWAKMGHSFWENLPWTNEGCTLLSALEGIFGDRIVIATSPPLTVGSTEGKIDWIRKHTPRHARNFCITPRKQFLAGPRRLLIDDHENNFDQFTAEGGSGVLVPRPWNRHRAGCDKNGDFNIPHVVSEIKKIIEG